MFKIVQIRLQWTEKDNEVAGSGNINTAELWEYDSRLGRRWNCDPLQNYYPYWSPFLVLANNPIFLIDNFGNKIDPWYLKNTQRIPYPGSIEYDPLHPYYSNYLNFTTEASTFNFTCSFLQLMRTNQVFARVVGQLNMSNNHYQIKERMSTNWFVDAAYNSKEKTKYLYAGNNLNNGAIFEEFYHAGQDEFYSGKNLKRSALENEIEAKVANLMVGFDDAAVKQNYEAIKSYMNTGVKSKNFDAEIDVLIQDVYNLYKAQNGEDWAKENKPENINKETLLSYLNSIYKKPEKPN